MNTMFLQLRNTILLQICTGLKVDKNGFKILHDVIGFDQVKCPQASLGFLWCLSVPAAYIDDSVAEVVKKMDGGTEERNTWQSIVVEFGTRIPTFILNGAR